MFCNKKEKIYIWGIGKNACVFMEQFRVYRESCVGFWDIMWENCFRGFIDRAPDKQGLFFYGKKVVSFEEAIVDGMDYCIITPTDSKAIETMLHSASYVGKYVYWKKYLQECRNELLQREDILLDRMRMTSVVNRGKPDEAALVDSLCWQYADEICKLGDWVPHRDSIAKRNIKTIALYVDRYYGGGIEKVVSLLIPGFLDAGYKIVLVTEELHPKKEYKFPEGVVRCVLKTKNDGIMRVRLNEWGKIIWEQGVDVVCFHSGYARIDTFYEILYIRRIGIPVVMELHSAYHALLEDQPEISEMFKYIYCCADIAITLSKRDYEYWTSQEVNCTSIWNPVETFGINCRIGRADTTDGHTILWVGRIVQNPKQVLDVVPIMHNVYGYRHDVKLIIAGGRDKAEIYKRLCEDISESGLQEIIEIREYEADICKLYKEADIVLMTSASESFCNVLAESKVFARPVVMYELPWLPLVEGNQGILAVRQRDTGAAAEAICKLLDDDELWERKSQEAWDSIQPYITHNVVDDWERVFADWEKYDD